VLWLGIIGGKVIIGIIGGKVYKLYVLGVTRVNDYRVNM
jgi:hypothetical protein